jgi:hypothetical protein
LDPFLILERDRALLAEMATRYFRNECHALGKCQDSNHTPTFYSQAELVQGDRDPFPGGYLHILVMSRVRGNAVTDIKSLTQEELSIIRQQLAEVLQ